MASFLSNLPSKLGGILQVLVPGQKRKRRPSTGTDNRDTESAQDTTVDNEAHSPARKIRKVAETSCVKQAASVPALSSDLTLDMDAVSAGKRTRDTADKENSPGYGEGGHVVLFPSKKRRRTVGASRDESRQKIVSKLVIEVPSLPPVCEAGYEDHVGKVDILAAEDVGAESDTCSELTVISGDLETIGSESNGSESNDESDEISSDSESESDSPSCESVQSSSDFQPSDEEDGGTSSETEVRPATQANAKFKANVKIKAVGTLAESNPRDAYYSPSSDDERSPLRRSGGRQLKERLDRLDALRENMGEELASPAGVREVRWAEGRRERRARRQRWMAEDGRWNYF